MPLVRYEIQSELALANRDLYRTAPKNDPEAILEGVAMVGLVGIVRQLGDLAEFAADVFHDLHEALLATASRSHDLVSRVSQLEGELGAVEKSMFSKKTNHLHFADAPGVDWRATVPTDQNFCTQGDLPRFIRSAYEACRGPPKLFLLDKFDVQGAGACLKRYTDPSFFKMEWASSEIMKAEKAQQQKKARRGKKRARGRKDSDGKDVKPAVQFQSRLRRTLSVEDASEDIMTVKSIPLNTTEGNWHQGSSVTSAAAPKSVRRFGSPKPLPPVTSLSRNSELRPKSAAFSRALEEDAARGSTDAEQYLDAMTNMESETDSEPLERRRFYDGFKRTRTAQTKSDQVGDVFFEDARNSTMESETESKYSVELSPIPVDSHLEFEDEAASNLDSIERTESEQHEDETGSCVRVQKNQASQTNGQEISQDIASKPDEDNDLERSGSASGSLHAEAGKSTGGPTNDQNQPLEDSNLEARNSEIESLHNELMDAEEAEDAEEADDEAQFDVELLRVIGYSAAEAQDIQKPEATVSEADRNLEQQTAAPMEVEASNEVENVGLDRPDSAGLRMEVADDGSLEGSTVLRTEAEAGIPSTDDSTLEADRTMLQAAEKYFSLDSNFEAGELLRQETPEKQNSGASSTSGTSTPLHEAVLLGVKMAENVPLVDDFESSSSEDVFMDADAGYQSSSRFSDADYNFGDASSEQFEQMESLGGRSEELPSSMQITPDKDDDSAADQHVYHGGHDTEEQVPETSEAVFEKQPGEQAVDQGTKKAFLPQKQTEQIAEERTKETVLEQQLAEQEALLEQPAEQIAEERWEEATQPADQATEQLIEEAVLEQEPAEQIAEQRTKEAPITVEQIADQTNKEEASMAAEHVAEQITKEAIAEQIPKEVIEEQQGTVEPVIEEQPALQQGIEEAVIETQLRQQVFGQGFEDVPQLGEQVLQQGVKQTESPAKDLSSPVSSTGSPVLQFCPETGSEDGISFKLGALSPLSPPDVSSESSSSPSSSSSSSPRSPVFSALRAPLSPTRRAGDDQRAGIETFLSPSSPTSTSELPSYPRSEPREMPPLPPLPPLRWLTSLASRDSQLSWASPSLSTPTPVETTKQADEAHVPMQEAAPTQQTDAPTQQTDAPMQQTDAPRQQMQQSDAVEDEMLVDVSLQHADAPKLETSAPVHSRELDVGATAQQPPSSDEEDDDVPELEIPQPSPELEIPEPDPIHKMRPSLEVPRGLLETLVAEKQEAEIGISTGVPEQKASHLEIQEAATEATPEPEVPAEPATAVLENELEVTSAPVQEQEPGIPEEATGVPEQEASDSEIQEAATEASTEPEVPRKPVLENELEVTSAPLQEQEPGFPKEATEVPEQEASHLEIQEAATEAEVPRKPAAALLENELEVTAAPLQVQEPGFSAAENEMIQQALNEDHSGLWRMAMQVEYDSLKMKMERTETSQQTVEPTVAGSADVEEVVEQRLETEPETLAKELEPEIPESDADVRREMGPAETQEAIVVEAKHLSEQDASELPAAGDFLTIPDSGEQLVLKQVALDETEPGEVMVPEDAEELQRSESLDLVGRPDGVDEDELAAKQTLDTDSKQSPAVDLKDQMPVPGTPETEDGLKAQLSTPPDDDALLVVFPKPGAVVEPTVELHDTLPVSTLPLKEIGDDLLIKAISQHDRSKLKKVASDLRPPPKAPDERDVLLEQIRSQSFNLRQTVPEKKEKPEVRQQPRIMSNINVAAILEKANAIRQAFVGSDDDEDDDWSDS